MNSTNEDIMIVLRPISPSKPNANGTLSLKSLIGVVLKQVMIASRVKPN